MKEIVQYSIIKKIFFLFFADIPDSLDTTDETENCDETISIEAGCDIVNRRCKCWDKMQVCKYHKMRWDFKNMEVSRSYLVGVMATVHALYFQPIELSTVECMFLQRKLIRFGEEDFIC